MPLASVDKLSDDFSKNLDTVLKELDRQLKDILSSVTTNGVVNATELLNAQAQMISALQSSGYLELAASQAQGYEQIFDAVKSSMKSRGLPTAKFSTVDATTLQQLAGIDVSAITAIGRDAIEQLNISLYKNALSGIPFSTLVEEIGAKLEGPLRNSAFTYANTANLSFSGEVLRISGENLGADKWQVVGPLDEVTRDVCVDALADPVRTTKEWQSADYFGGVPGGFNCRHQLFPVFE